LGLSLLLFFKTLSENSASSFLATSKDFSFLPETVTLHPDFKKFLAEIKMHEGIHGAYVEIPFDVEAVFGTKPRL